MKVPWTYQNINRKISISESSMKLSVVDSTQRHFTALEFCWVKVKMFINFLLYSHNKRMKNSNEGFFPLVYVYLHLSSLWYDECIYMYSFHCNVGATKLNLLICFSQIFTKYFNSYSWLSGWQLNCIIIFYARSFLLLDL